LIKVRKEMDATLADDFRILIKSFNWYNNRGKVFGETEFRKWKRGHSAADTNITSKLTDFAFETMTKHVRDFYKYVLENNLELEQCDKTFLNNYENSELFQIDEALEDIRSKKLGSTMDSICQNLGKVSLNVNVSIDSLDGNEEDPQDWFENFERIGISNGWTEEILAVKLPCYLKDTPLLVWQSIDNREKSNYKKVKQTILDQFKSDESYEQLFYNRKQKENESCLEYALKLEKLAKRAFPGIDREKETIRVFSKGTLANIKQLILMTSPRTLKEAVEAARKAEEFLKENNNNKEIQSVKEQTETEINTMRQERRSRPEKTDPRRRKSESRSSSRGSSSGNCYLCNKPGHIARNCRKGRDKTPVSTKRSPRQIRCYNCNRMGHRAVDCYSRKN
jgi:hypothetical protein